MYMLKLRHNSFGNSAGTCWRLLFIYALMPWMRKYRKYDDSLDIADFKFAANRMWTGRMPPRSTLFQEDPNEELSVKNLGISKGNSSEEADDLIALLRQHNEILKKENEILRSRMFRHKSSEASINKSCPPQIFNKPPVGFI